MTGSPRSRPFTCSRNTSTAAFDPLAGKSPYPAQRRSREPLLEGAHALPDFSFPAGRKFKAMFQRILLPVDLTEKHERALNIAAEFAGRSGEITLLHVIEVIPGLSMDEERAFYNRLERLARSHIDKLGSLLEKRKVSWKSQVLFGNRAQESIRYAIEAAAE